MYRFRPLAIGVIAGWMLLIASNHRASADTFSFDSSDFTTTPVFSNVNTFSFTIDIDAPIFPGAVLVNPTLNSVDYSVNGNLSSTPSGFSAFALVRNIGGAEFYTQGSSLSFSVSPTADLSDGLQISDLTGADPVFIFNGREVGTGRYHPALLQLNADGTGSIQNSNNFGGTNPSSGNVVDVALGEEYITNLTFNPTTFTLADNITAIPEPNFFGICLLLGAAIAIPHWIRRFRTAF